MVQTWRARWNRTENIVGLMGIREWETVCTSIVFNITVIVLTVVALQIAFAIFTSIFWSRFRKILRPLAPRRGALGTDFQRCRALMTCRVVRLSDAFLMALVAGFSGFQLFVLFVLDFPLQYVLTPGTHVVDLNGVQPFGAYVGVVEVVFESKPILMLLRSVAGRVTLLAAHNVCALHARRSIEIARKRKKLTLNGGNKPIGGHHFSKLKPNVCVEQSRKWLNSIVPRSLLLYYRKLVISNVYRFS